MAWFNANKTLLLAVLVAAGVAAIKTLDADGVIVPTWISQALAFIGMFAAGTAPHGGRIMFGAGPRQGAIVHKFAGCQNRSGRI